MKAFFVHDETQDRDLMVVPETDCVVAVNRGVLEEFIAVTPDFTKYSGSRLNHRPPETFGVIAATRKTDGDVCIIEEPLWLDRMERHLSGA